MWIIKREEFMKKLFYNAPLYLVIIFILYSPYRFSQSSGYRIKNFIVIGGEGGWDYLAVDQSTNRLFVSHGNKVHAIDLATEKVTGEITDLQGVHGIAFAPEVNKGFISEGKANRVTVFDLKTLEVTSKIVIDGKNPDAILYDPFSKRVFTFNGRSGNATVINSGTEKIEGTIPLGGKPEFSVTDSKGNIYVNIEDLSTIKVIDSKEMKVLSTWPVAPCEEPSGLSFDIKHKILFSVGGNKLMAVVDAKDGKIVTTIPIGGGVDASGYDPETQLIFASNGEGTLTVVKEISTKEFKVLENISTIKGARTMAVDLKTHRLFLSCNKEDEKNQKTFGVLVLDKK